MTGRRQSLGRWGEELAAKYLRRRFYRLLETNYRCRAGEIDIIARRGGIIAFIEVKTRRGRRCGSASEAVTVRKQGQIIRAARWYLAAAGGDLQPRFDVIAIDVDGDGHRLEHIVDAFTIDD